MKHIGLLSDTHSCWDDRFETYLAGCDEIWHAGDIGNAAVASRLKGIAPLRAVCGNCDGRNIRLDYHETLRFEVEQTRVLMTHIGGTPGHYDPGIRMQLSMDTPDLFVCGHSHILKVQYDTTLGMMYINPGAAGLQGWQTVRTLVRFNIGKGKIHDLEVIELRDSSNHCTILD